MMVTVSGKFLEGGEKNLPPLSPNLEASQLLTPLQLERITIDNPHYREHLMHSILHQSLVSPVPNHQHVLHRRTAKLGDNYFFLQKDIPVPQNYARTALKLSEVRPWDQIVDRPLYTQRVIGKEVHLPFPQEHPYTSHISRFAVFPDTKYHQPAADDNQPHSHEEISSRRMVSGPHNVLLQTKPNKASVQTQTALTSFATSFKPLPAYYIHQKASDWGQRVEEQHLSVAGIPSLNTDVGRTFWDLPRSRQHKRANTYPAPRLLYSAQVPDTPTTLPNAKHLTTPQLLAPPTSQTTATPPITPRTNEALNTIHTLLTRTTTYAEQFPRHTPLTTPTNQNILRLDYSLRSCGSQRPWTNESRGKYCRRIPLSTLRTEVESERDDASVADSDALGMSDGVVFSLLKENHGKGEETSEKGEETHRSGVESHGTINRVGEDEEENGFRIKESSKLKTQNEESKSKKEIPSQHETPGRRKVVMVDSTTQTSEEDFSSVQKGTPLPQVRYMTAQQEVQNLSQLPRAQGLNRLPHVAGFRHQPPTPVAAATAMGVKGVVASSGEMANSLQSIATPRSMDLASEGSQKQPVPPTARSPDASRQSYRQLHASQLVKYPLAKRPLSAYVDSLPAYYALQKPSHVRSYSANAADLYPPPSSSAQVRTGEVTRRLMGLYNGFNKTDVLKKFHEQYPEKAPDLREYSIRDGKRHVIHGSHAYYFH